MECRCRRTTHKERYADARLLQFARHATHLVERWGDKAAQTDEIYLVLLCRADYLLRLDHHTQVNDLEVVARQYHAYDVLADVVHIALHRCQQIARHLACADRLRRLDVRLQNIHRALHRAGTLDHLRQEHLALAKEFSHDCHTLHQRLLDDGGRGGVGGKCLLDILLQKLLVTALQGLCKSLGEWRREALLGRCCDLCRLLAITLGKRDKAVGGILCAAENHILQHLKQLLWNILIHHRRRRVYNRHIHTRTDCVIEEHGVHCFTQKVVATQRE